MMRRFHDFFRMLMIRDRDGKASCVIIFQGAKIGHDKHEAKL